MATSNEFIDQIDRAVRLHFVDENPEETEVRRWYENMFDAFSFAYPTDSGNTEKETTVDSLVRKFCAEQSVTKKFGFAYKDSDVCKPWLRAAEESIEERDGWFYWQRYKDYLLYTKKWARASVNSIDRDSWNILDLMANPVDKTAFERRGLVVASVQSGKTSNYTALICRAADAGYKIIIVMAGVYNVLRNQTQARLEEGFTGFNIVGEDIHPVGVGLQHHSAHRPIACTSRDADFNKGRASALKGIQTANTNDPWLFVIKKNSHALKQVYEWLKDNANPNDQLLLIDDEADNASINGKYKRDNVGAKEETTRINGQIRHIFNYFSRKCYVGYTATPFANILIDPNVDSDTYGKDLFPSSFIYTLEESSDYFGASKVFSDMDSDRPAHLRYIDDIDQILPPKHRSNFKPDALPESLKEALRAFVIATTIRALRGDADEHCTMMVNVSPYKVPQKAVADLLDDEVASLKDLVKSYAALPEGLALRQPGLSNLRKTWQSEFPGDYTWREIQGQLYETMRDIHVVSINSDSNQLLEYDQHTEHVVAVGGYRLSRGLTLEGLLVSYYSRNAKAYDALMQMARWFGYRPGYEDLCRIWMSEQSAGWYKFVADSTDDLFDDLRTMRSAHLTPKDYGLKIRQSPDSLIVTARNKMGAGTRVAAPIDLNGSFAETIAFDRLGPAIDQNKEDMAKLVGKLGDFQAEDWSQEHLFYRHVPRDFITKYLGSYWNEDARSPKSQTQPILNYIEERLVDGELRDWDVLVAQGNGSTISVGDGIYAKQEVRYPGRNTDADCLVVGEKQRLASRGIEKAGLSEAQKRAAEEDFKKDHGDQDVKNISDRYYRMHRTYPLLILHPVLIRYSDSQIASRKENGAINPTAGDWPAWDHEEHAYGWSISFPHTSRHTRTVDYIFNAIAMRAIRDDFVEEGDDDYEDE